MRRPRWRRASCSSWIPARRRAEWRRRQHQHEQTVDKIELHRAQMLPQSSFVALQHRNFRLLWTGQLISFSGSNMQIAALLWHVSLLVPAAQRPIALGMVGLVRLMPIVFFSIAGGTMADAFDRRRLMLITQSGMAVTALA